MSLPCTSRHMTMGFQTAGPGQFVKAGGRMENATISSRGSFSAKNLAAFAWFRSSGSQPRRHMYLKVIRKIRKHSNLFKVPCMVPERKTLRYGMTVDDGAYQVRRGLCIDILALFFLSSTRSLGQASPIAFTSSGVGVSIIMRESSTSSRR